MSKKVRLKKNLTNQIQDHLFHFLEPVSNQKVTRPHLENSKFGPGQSIVLLESSQQIIVLSRYCNKDCPVQILSVDWPAGSVWSSTARLELFIVRE